MILKLTKSSECHHIRAHGQPRQNWELLCSQTECFLCNFLADAVNFKHDAARSNHCYVMIQRTLTLTHPHLLRFAGDRLIWEDANPNLTLPFHVTGHCDTSGLNLTVGDSATCDCFQAVNTEGNDTSPYVHFLTDGLLLFAIFRAFRL